MSDEVRNAAFIGASINKGLGSIPVPKGKKNNKDKDKDTKTAETTKPAETTQPAPETKAIPKVKNPSSKKPPQKSAPVFVKSERVNKPTITPTKEITPGQGALPFDPRSLPTSGPGSEFNPNRGRQFNG
jgi:hypothetical protein